MACDLPEGEIRRTVRLGANRICAPGLGDLVATFSLQSDFLELAVLFDPREKSVPFVELELELELECSRYRPGPMRVLISTNR